MGASGSVLSDKKKMVVQNSKDSSIEHARSRKNSEASLNKHPCQSPRHDSFRSHVSFATTNTSFASENSELLPLDVLLKFDFYERQCVAEGYSPEKIAELLKRKHESYLIGEDPEFENCSYEELFYRNKKIEEDRHKSVLSELIGSSMSSPASPCSSCIY